jgi:GNAT superfamily N-acetyltransferase
MVDGFSGGRPSPPLQNGSDFNRDFQSMHGIRRATSKDTDELLALLRAMHAESIFRSIRIDPNRLKSFIAFCIDQPTHVCIVYENASGKIDGTMLGYVQPYFFSNELGAWDIALYVRPECRGSMIAFRLWREFKAWATTLRARVLWLGTSAGIAPARTRKFYTGLGMSEVGSLYRLSLDS